MPFFSLIIPTYNSEKDIARCCSSILNQTFTNYEILVQDALSTDSTLEILSRLKLPGSAAISVCSEKDKGIYDAMNKGIKRAAGEWIYFLGSDDELYDENVLAKIYGVCSAGNYEVVYGNIFSSRFNGIYDGEFTNEKLLENNICHQAIFVKNTVFKKIGYFNVKYTGQADWEHNMRWFLSGKIAKKYVDVIVCNYADGGFSSLHGDSVFGKEKVLQYLISGRRKLGLKVKIRMLKSFTGFALAIKDYRLVARIILYSPLILL